MSHEEPPTTEDTPSSRSKDGFFPQTRWTLVLKMQDPAASQLGYNALNELCEIYWQPVYIYVRSWDKSPADAEDLAQGFFSMILSKQSLDLVAPEKGKLRSFLLVALKRYLANAHHRESALKRGGGQKPISIDAEWTQGHSKKIEPAGGDSPMSCSIASGRSPSSTGLWTSSKGLTNQMENCRSSTHSNSPSPRAVQSARSQKLPPNSGSPKAQPRSHRTGSGSATAKSSKR